MPKKIKSAAEYAVNMINVMVEHDSRGAMHEWVDGSVNAWLRRLLAAIHRDKYQISALSDLEERAIPVINRALDRINNIQLRTDVKVSLLNLNILTLNHFTEQEQDHVKLKPVD